MFGSAHTIYSCQFIIYSTSIAGKMLTTDKWRITVTIVTVARSAVFVPQELKPSTTQRNRGLAYIGMPVGLTISIIPSSRYEYIIIRT